MSHASDPKKSGNCFGPTAKAPTDQPGGQANEMCEGTIEGTVKIECCCPMLYTRTLGIALGPQTEPQLAAAVGGTAQAYEASGYRVIAHSLVDTGSGWQLFLTIGWYA